MRLKGRIVMSKNKKERKDSNENTNGDSSGSNIPGENGNSGAQKSGNGGDLSSVKFNQIFIALGVCIILMIIAKLIGL